MRLTLGHSSPVGQAMKIPIGSSVSGYSRTLSLLRFLLYSSTFSRGYFIGKPLVAARIVFFSLVLCIVSNHGLVFARGKKHPLTLFETHPAPKPFRKMEIPPGHKHTLTLKIGLKTRGDALLKKRLMEVSDPESPLYGQHLTFKEVRKLNSPGKETMSSVLNWLLEHGFSKEFINLSSNKDWVTIKNVPLRKAEAMLNTTYHYYQHDDGEVLIRTESYSLPLNLHNHVDLIQPTTMFGRLSPRRSTITGIQKISSNSATASTKCNSPSMIAVTGFLGQRANRKDLSVFLQHEGLPSDLNFTVASINGGTNPQINTPADNKNHLGVEANLDIQTVIGITGNMPHIFYTIGGSPPFLPTLLSPTNTNEPYLEWLDYMSSQPDGKLPYVMEMLSNQFPRLTRADGDEGVGTPGTCLSNDGKNSSTFISTFPASCPYVTAVGATENFSPEVATSPNGPGGFYSGGGFSSYFEQPSYQQKSVQAYLKKLGEKYHGLYPPKGRGYPDVSAQGAKYAIAWQQKLITVGGTSASTPTFAGIIALLNDYRLSKGQSPLGLGSCYRFGNPKFQCLAESNIVKGKVFTNSEARSAIFYTANSSSFLGRRFFPWAHTGPTD
ncbi:hypothetical protein O181_030350 [Austropuccinia psidii MF-1]|uniref:tripeptidyl-peptidase II n=1 Tax=Austropuccinia psidii MF-1 TaxID=1389203 RepID=A0A9Q3CW46_9BASI|nr:hypothetical protein [Austropuccinia psidii MF-1]